MEAARGMRSNSKMGQGAHVCASRQVAFASIVGLFCLYSRSLLPL
jgi:hypothetical protein